jgi:hypothetical protein
MPTTWHSLYLQNDDLPAVAAALVESLQSLGYQRYDPFPGGMGTPPGLKNFAKYFVAPAQDGWVRVLGQPEPDLLPNLSRKFSLLYIWLTDAASGVEAYIDGERHDDRLREFLRPGASLPDATNTYHDDTSTENNAAGLTLPDDVQQLAQDHNVNPDQANKLVSRLTSQLFGKLDRTSGGEASAMQDQARALVSGGAVNWNSAPARRLKAIMDALTVPANWRDPDFDRLRDAYQVARRLRRTPSAQLMPDEQASIKAIPNAIEYEAVYMGK